MPTGQGHLGSVPSSGREQDLVVRGGGLGVGTLGFYPRLCVASDESLPCASVSPIEWGRVGSGGSEVLTPAGRSDPHSPFRAMPR